MTVYAELLKLTLGDGSDYDQSLDQLVSEALARRDAMARDGDAATRLAAALAYDAALVRLCRALGVDQDLTGNSAGLEARRRAEDALSMQLPNLEVTLR